MGILGSAIGGALGIGASIFGGISASKAMKKAKESVKSEMQENQSWYDRRYNEDATQRADAQRILTMTNENIRQRNQQAAGAQAVMGGTEESVAAAKAASNQALADATSQIAVNGERRKDQVESQYMNTKADLNNKMRSFELGKAQAMTQATQGMVDAGASLGGMF
ncbi:MAG: hypothetical protein NC217_08840 [Muribaculaceae bacterium]|nr:hypothetical protein [Muribaculaceae bacterium]